MFRNLRAEMKREGLCNDNIAETLELTGNSISNKLNGKTEWTRKEMFTLKEKYFPNCTIEYLFERSE